MKNVHALGIKIGKDLGDKPYPNTEIIIEKNRESINTFLKKTGYKGKRNN